MSASVHNAGIADLPGTLAIYNDAVGNTTATWSETSVNLVNRQAWFDTRARQGYSIPVASDVAGEMLGCVSYGDWRPFEGLHGTAKHPVYVRGGRRSKDLDIQLLQAPIGRARVRGLHVMVAAIESGSATSVGLHQHPGFEISGQIPQVGQRFGHWLGLTFMQSNLDPTHSMP